VEKAVIELQKLLQETSLESHAQPGSFLLKPAVGACGEHVGLIKDKKLKNLKKQFKKHCEEHGNVKEWLLQPFFPRMPWGEYKVFLGHNGEAMVVYAPMDLETKSSAVVFCPPRHVYNYMFSIDNLADPVPVHEKPREVEPLAKTWENTHMYDAIIKFAQKCRDAFAGHKEMHCLANTVCRVDIICLFDIKCKDNEVAELDTANPILLLNEMDNLWSASLMLDINNPQRDSLSEMLPELADHPVAERTSVQLGWIRGLKQLLFTADQQLLVDPVVDHQVDPVVDHQVDPVVDHQVDPVVDHQVDHQVERQHAVDTFLNGVMEYTRDHADYVTFNRELSNKLFSMCKTSMSKTSDMTRVEFMKRVESYFERQNCWSKRCKLTHPETGNKRKSTRNVAFHYKLRYQ